MEAARTRIGLVRLKSGGSVRLLPKPETNDTAQHLREWAAGALCKNRPPDAYAAVAYWLYPDAPGRSGRTIGYHTSHEGLPLPLLVRLAGASLHDDFVAERGKEAAAAAFGFDMPEWTPDGAV